MTFVGDKDDFWDIDKLIPKKYTPSVKDKLPSGAERFSTRQTVSEVTVDGDTESHSLDRRLTLQDKSAGYDETEYTPEGAGLIKTVRIRNYRDRYDFYDSFRKAAILYYDCTAPRCDYVSFYSYMPQYSQLNREQRSYYFYWRDEMRHQRYIKTDYSYLYLYVYEILNLPDKIPPKRGLELLCDLWERYRTELPRIDASFVVWVQDYCLVHRLACPLSRLGGFIYDIINIAPFKEFYLSDPTELIGGTADALLAYLSDYDWRRGRYSSGENKEMYKRHMEGAMRRIILRLFGDGEFITLSGQTERISRAAFPNSLCTHSVKRNIEIEYYPISHSHTVRRIVTEAVRYTENKLRGLFGIKSRLAVKNLEDGYKRLIDTYFDRIAEDERQKTRLANRPEYEKLYEARNEGISLAGADEIERASWSVTARLVENSEDDTVLTELIHSQTETEAEGEIIDEPKAYEDCNIAEDSSYGLTEEEIRLVKRALDGVIKQELGLDSLIERINESFSDNMGDVIFESDGEAYYLIEDYREDIEEWLSRKGK